MKISVIIPSFNGGKYLQKAIESFLAQDYDDKELVIFDGKSTDESHKIIANFQERFPQFVKWIKESDTGISHGRNLALKHATGDLIGFLGADDFLHKDFFSGIAYYVKMNAEFDVLYFNSYTAGINSSFDASAQIMMTKRNLIKHCPIGSGESFYYRRKIFESHKFNENNRYTMDYEFNMALVASGQYKFAPVNIIAVFNGSYGDSVSSSLTLKQRLETVAVQLKYGKNCKEKLAIFWRKKKLVLKNLGIFLAIKNNLK